MAYLIAIPLLGALILVQMAVLSRAPLLHGTPDLMLLVVAAWAIRPRVRSQIFWTILGIFFVGYTSALGYLVPAIAYGITVLVATALRRRVWRALLLAYLLVVLIGSMSFHALTVLFLFVQGASLPLAEIVNQIVLPSLVLNLSLALPVYVLVGDLADRLYPEELDI
ncbi:MAG: hypothetical protein ACOYYS_18865 [Chloroflexota bacterium]